MVYGMIIGAVFVGSYTTIAVVHGYKNIKETKKIAQLKDQMSVKTDYSGSDKEISLAKALNNFSNNRLPKTSDVINNRTPYEKQNSVKKLVLRKTK